jgi:uncharacterized protein with PIN domain
MIQSWFRFYEELNDFLPAARKKQEFQHTFEGSPSVKDTIESLGVPHVEVDLILVNGTSVDFSYRMKNDDHVSVYPVFESFDISDVQHLRNTPLREPKFIFDVHLGKMAKYFRMLGFDSLYETDYDDDTIMKISVDEERIILTRDKLLLRNNKINHGLWVRSTDPLEQAAEIIKRLSLQKKAAPFTRCLECNGLLSEVAKEKITARLPERTIRYFEKFLQCRSCGKVYWEGSHFERMKKLIDVLIS